MHFADYTKQEFDNLAHKFREEGIDSTNRYVALAFFTALEPRIGEYLHTDYESINQATGEHLHIIAPVYPPERSEVVGHYLKPFSTGDEGHSWFASFLASRGLQFKKFPILVFLSFDETGLASAKIHGVMSLKRCEASESREDGYPAFFSELNSHAFEMYQSCSTPKQFVNSLRRAKGIRTLSDFLTKTKVLETFFKRIIGA